MGWLLRVEVRAMEQSLACTPMDQVLLLFILLPEEMTALILTEI
jgi:hypothetical protein